ncbi:MAG: hypothetical protein PHV07_03255 [Oscillospiraceae bacterium]|nr:hypothetical protein [Oscillospiraceae bacterium]
MKDHKLRWMRLDNAAKIYPAAKRRRWNNLFRISITLKEPIDKEILQSALDVTVKRFPSIAVRVRRGVFWYYLEEIPKAPNVRQDTCYPLSRMPFNDIRKCAFRVLYYENRIAVEIFHALTDGNGGMIFLKTLVAEYLSQKHGITIPSNSGVLDRSEEPSDAELEDSFLKNEGNVSSGRQESNAYRLKGTHENDGFLHLTSGVMDVNQVLQIAKSFNVTLTELITSVMIASIIEIQNEKVPNRNLQKPVKVLVPVNLRKMFESISLRNFVLYITPGINPRMGDYSFEEITKIVHHKMGIELNNKYMSSLITANVKAEKILLLKIMPLFIKNIALKTVYNMVGEKKSCLTLSNLGVVKLPEEMSQYVERVDFVLGIQATGTNNCGVLSFGDKLYINIIRNIKEPTLEHSFFNYLKNLGLNMKIESNQR